MQIQFYKYQGTGNDFVMIDNRTNYFPKNQQLIAKLCDRKFGIGSDGLILIENTEQADFEMVYFNADGNLGSMCGNGGRCTVAFAHFLGIIQAKTTFVAYDGLHQATVLEDGEIDLVMNEVSEIEKDANFYFLDTGSPHFVQFLRDVATYDVVLEGKKIRYNERFAATGTNVNFVEIDTTNSEKNSIFVRTYERGVEDETLSCGTGVTASAISFVLANYPTQENGDFLVKVRTLGGNLRVRLHKKQQHFTQISLIGAAKQVFEGNITISQ